MNKVTSESDNTYLGNRAQYCNGVSEIDLDQYEEMLNVLPPFDWRGIGSGNESFKMCERISGNLTQIFCRIGGRYFTLVESIHKPHHDIVAHCLEYITMNAGD